MKQAPYINWRERSSQLTPQTKRIGDDVILIEEYSIPAYAYHPFKVDTVTAIIYEEGDVRFKINMREYHVSAPALVIMLADQTFQYIASESPKPQMKAIVFSNRVLTGLFNDSHTSSALYRSLYNNPVLSFEDVGISAILHYYDLLCSLINSPLEGHKIEAVQHLTLALFYAYVNMKHEMPTLNEERNRATELTDRFFTLLREHYKQEREVNYYASRLFITPKYLSKTVKAESGRTPSEWIDNYVIDESKALLSSTTLTIQQISEELGFISTALFGKFFKRVEGISPSAYRKMR